MNQKKILRRLVLMVTLIAPTFLNAEDCSLCDKEVRSKQVFYEDENVMALYDYKPIIRGHCLVMPKRHVSQMQEMNTGELISTQKAISKLFQAAQKSYESDSYLILQKNGKAAGQSVPHVHFHFFPRKEGDYSDIGLLARFYISSFKSPLSQEAIDKERKLLSKNISEIDVHLELQEAQ